MVSYYSVLTFENLMTGECINVGVAALNDTEVKFSVLQDWTRFEAMFKHKDSILEAVLHNYCKVPTTPEELKKLIIRQSGMSSLNFSDLRSSLLNIDETLKFAKETFLVECS